MPDTIAAPIVVTNAETLPDSFSGTVVLSARAQKISAICRFTQSGYAPMLKDFLAQYMHLNSAALKKIKVADDRTLIIPVSRKLSKGGHASFCALQVGKNAAPSTLWFILSDTNTNIPRNYRLLALHVLQLHVALSLALGASWTCTLHKNMALPQGWVAVVKYNLAYNEPLDANHELQASLQSKLTEARQNLTFLERCLQEECAGPTGGFISRIQARRVLKRQAREENSRLSALTSVPNERARSKNTYAALPTAEGRDIAPALQALNLSAVVSAASEPTPYEQTPEPGSGGAASRPPVFTFEYGDTQALGSALPAQDVTATEVVSAGGQASALSLF